MNYDFTEERLEIPFPFRTIKYKLQLDLDIQFYDLNLSNFSNEITIDGDDSFYEKERNVITTVLSIELANGRLVQFPYIDHSKLQVQSQYAVMAFKSAQKYYSTKGVLGIEVLEMDSIEIVEYDILENVKLVAVANKDKLKQIGFV